MSKQPQHIDPAADKQIKEMICEKLTAIHGWDTTGIHVEVLNGVATLAGIVSHKDEIHKAEEIAATVTGVATIKNMLEVKGSGIAEMLSELGSDIARVISGTDSGQKPDESTKKP
jgi:hypothetical protein